jgi:Protein of unknown function (DUF1236)
MTKVAIVFASLLALGSPTLAQAQGIVGGAQHGAREGAHAAGPIGGLVGGVVGGVTGGIAGLLGVNDRPRFHDYVVRRHLHSYRYGGRIAVGAVLPPGVVYYGVPPGYGVRPYYRYAIVNGHTVLVDPRTHEIVQVVD